MNLVGLEKENKNEKNARSNQLKKKNSSKSTYLTVKILEARVRRIFPFGAHLLTAVTALAELPAGVLLKICLKCVYFEFLFPALKRTVDI